MKAKIKAKELVKKFSIGHLNDLNVQCAIVCVDEIIKSNPTCEEQFFYVDAQGNKTEESFFKTKSSYLFWQEVLTHLKSM